MIPLHDDQLNELAMLEVTHHQIEEPSVSDRDGVLSDDTDDGVVVFRAVFPLPSGIGTAGRHDDGRDRIVSVAMLLGEEVEFIRRRGFHVHGIEGDDDEPDAST